MKRVLFVIQSIGFGGSMTSLINLLGFLKNDQNFSIDVLIMDKYGELLEQAEEVANVLPENRICSHFKRHSAISESTYLVLLKLREVGDTSNSAFGVRTSFPV